MLLEPAIRNNGEEDRFQIFSHTANLPQQDPVNS